MNISFSIDKLLKILVISIFYIIQCGCANNPLRNYSHESNKIINSLKSNDIQGVINHLDASSDLNDNLELSLLYRMNANYIASNKSLILANQKLDKWLESYHNKTFGKLVDTVSFGIINDKISDYQFKDYEKVFLYTYLSLNYLNMNNIDDARVTIKKMYQLEDAIAAYRETEYNKVSKNKEYRTLDELKSINTKVYNFDLLEKPSVLQLKNSYQNAFSHYLAGFIFDNLGETDLSIAGYKRALSLSPNNPTIIKSLEHVSNTNNNSLSNNKNNNVDVLFIEEVGHLPIIKAVFVPLLFNIVVNDCFTISNISLPMLFPYGGNQSILLSEDNHNFFIDNQVYHTNKILDADYMAARFMHDNLPNIYMTNLLRISRDLTLQRVMCNNGLGGLNLLFYPSSFLINKADERTWLLLPNKIYIERLSLSKKLHTLSVFDPNINDNRKVNLDLTNSGSFKLVTWRKIDNQLYLNTN